MMKSIRAKFELQDKVAIVSGASKGIGAAIASGLAEFGAHVIVCSRKSEGIEAVADAIRSHGGKASAKVCHVGDPDQCADLIDWVLSQHQRIDILINNAAVNPFYGPLQKMDLPAYHKTQAINLEAPMRLSNLVFPVMKEQGNGSIIHISSIEAQHPGKGMSAYCISKAGIEMLTKSQAYEWGRYGIRVNAIAPGLIDTKFSKALIENREVMEFIENKVPSGRVAQPDEMAGLAVFLASDASSYCTGGVYMADGGFTLANAL